MLRIENISKTFNRNTVNEKKALTNLTLTIEDGDFVTVIGGNGSGKSTMLNVVAGVLPVDTGKIYVDKDDVTRLAEYKRASYIGRVFQDPMMGTAAKMMIEENLALAYRRGERRGFSWGVSKSERDLYRRQLEPLKLGLEDRLSERAGTLSGGQRQALTLLMATLKKPKLLLLDEHTAALDPKTAKTVLAITKQIVERDKLTTVMVTHNMRDAIALGNRLLMFSEGRIVVDVAGEAKQDLTVEKLLQMFDSASENGSIDDNLLLA